MAYTSPSEINMTEGIGNLFIWINEVTDFWFGRALIGSIFAIILLGYLKSNKEDIVGGLALSGYITFVIALLFWVIGFIDPITMGLSIGAVLGFTAWLLIDRRE